MKQLRLTLAVLYVLAMGCGSEELKDFVENDGKVGRGYVAGIHFEVQWPGGREAKMVGAENQDPAHSLYTITLGTVEIGVSRQQLSVNGKEYGSLNEGDRIVINQHRKVMVNGAERSVVK